MGRLWWCERGGGLHGGHLQEAGAGADEKCLRESARVSGRRGRAMVTGGGGGEFKAGLIKTERAIAEHFDKSQ